MPCLRSRRRNGFLSPRRIQPCPVPVDAQIAPALQLREASYRSIVAICLQPEMLVDLRKALQHFYVGLAVAHARLNSVAPRERD